VKENDYESAMAILNDINTTEIKDDEEWVKNLTI
jgi:hypothetical protein